MVNNGDNYGYVVISRKEGLIKITEYAIQEDIFNPFKKLSAVAGITNSNIKYYMENPLDYGVWDVDNDTAYEYNNGNALKIINDYSCEGKNNKKTNESKTGIRSGLNGYTVMDLK